MLYIIVQTKECYRLNVEGFPPLFQCFNFVISETRSEYLCSLLVISSLSMNSGCVQDPWNHLHSTV